MKIQESGNIEMFGNQPLVSEVNRLSAGVGSIVLGLLMALVVVCGMLTLAVVSTLGWLYGVRQNGVVSGFPQRQRSI